jgi:hypothetical protein
MPVTYHDSLERIRAWARSRGYPPQPPASESALAALKDASTARLGYEVDPQYLQFLSQSDGLAFNGYTVFASRIVPLAAHPDRLLGGFVDTNVQLREVDPNRRFVAFGETGNERYVFDVRRKTFAEVDHPSLDVLRDFASFDEMLAYMLERALE